jgi:Secretion system C-terminal sorting domain
LPVQLVQFLANKNDDGSVKVIWSTSQEQNSDYYDVERSGDQAVWSSIGTVKAKGFSSTTSNYFLTDKSPLSGTGYYRLKMVDLDGKFVYSKTVTVTTENSSVPLVVYSNPFSDQIRLKINLSRPQNLMMTVSDMQGKTYITQSYQAQSGDNFVNIQPSLTSSGMYILKIQGDTYNQTIKLEKQ